MHKVKRYRRRDARDGARRREGLYKTDYVICVDNHAVQQARSSAIRKQHRHANRSVRTSKGPSMGEQSAYIAHHAPGIHLPRRPHTLAKKEVAGKGRQRAYHKARARAQACARDNGDGRDGLEIRDGPKQDAPRRRQGSQHKRGHDLPQRRTTRLVTCKEHGEHEHHHGEHQQSRLGNAQIQHDTHA